MPTALGQAPVYTDTDGRLRPAVGTFGMDVSGRGIGFGSPEWFALGLSESGAFVVNKFGRDPDVDAATVPEDVWNGGGVYAGFPTGAAESVQAVSSDPGDTGTLTLTGLDADYSLTTRTVTLTGTTPATVPGGTMRRVHTASYDTGDDTGFNAGEITVRHAVTTANVFIVMAAGRSQSNAAAYTVPAGHTALVNHVSGAVLGGVIAVVDGALWVREFGKSPRLRRPFTISPEAPFDDYMFGGVVLPEKTDIIPRLTQCSVNNVGVTVKYDLLVVPNG